MKLLVVQIGRIGDMVLTTPMFRAVAEHLPGAELHVLTAPRGLPVLANSDRIDRIHVYRKGPLALPPLLLRLRAERFDAWVDPKDHPSGEGSLLAALGGARRKIGFDRPGKRVFDVPIPSAEANSGLHVAERNLRALRTLIPGDPSRLDPRPELFVDPACAVALAPGTVVINLSAGSATRVWPEENWSEVAAECARLGLPVAVMSAAADRAIAQRVAARDGCTLLDTPTLGHAIAAVGAAALVVSPDTSIVHIAAAFDVPIVALFPRIEANLAKFRPLSTRAVVVLPAEGRTFQEIPAGSVIEELRRFTLAKTPVA